MRSATFGLADTRRASSAFRSAHWVCNFRYAKGKRRTWKRKTHEAENKAGQKNIFQLERDIIFRMSGEVSLQGTGRWKDQYIDWVSGTHGTEWLLMWSKYGYMHICPSTWDESTMEDMEWTDGVLESHMSEIFWKVVILVCQKFDYTLQLR